MSTRLLSRLGFLVSLVLLTAIVSPLTGPWCCGQERTPWTSSRLQGSPEPPRPYSLERVYPNLDFRQPVELIPLPGTQWIAVLELNGKVYCFKDSPDSTEKLVVCDLRDISPDFGQAYTLCPHPDFESNGQLFVGYSEKPATKPDGSKICRLHITLDPQPHIDLEKSETIITWASGGHNGCSIRFDAQGLLYFSAGDGARPYPPDEYDVSQDLSDLRSTICRIDVDHPLPGQGYSIPESNPFIETPNARPEIWAYGFRNPWRFTIDPETQNVLCGDVGWELWELIFHVESGGNYGWSIYEGPQPIRSDIAPGPTPIRKPLVAYPHADGLSVTGGVVYRGAELPELEGTFLYGDYVTGLLWGLRFEGTQVTFNELLAETGIPIISFCESFSREVLVLSYDGGIYRLIENPRRLDDSQFPHKLSQTGLFESTVSLSPAPGVYHYELVATAFQGQGISSVFHIAVPGSQTISTGKLKRNWRFPAGTVFSKTLIANPTQDAAINASLPSKLPPKDPSRRIETQLLIFDGLSWQPYCYVWNQQQTDAELLPAEGGSSALSWMQVAGLPENWRHHSRSECRACHTNQTGGAVGFSYENLKAISASSYGDPIQACVDLKILDKQPPRDWQLGRMVHPEDTSQSLQDRARSYLHANCAHCHRRGGGGTVPLDIVYGNQNEAINALDFQATQGTFGLGTKSADVAKVIVPGEPHASVLYYRMATSGKGHMPKLWNRDNDTPGLQLVHDWILELDPDRGQSKPESLASHGASDTRQALLEFSRLLNEPADKRTSVARAALASADPLTRGLYERFLPAGERMQRLGNQIDRQAILSMPGDAARGKERFLHSAAQQCRSCHRLSGQGSMIGPDLDSIGQQRTKAELLESILAPSERIEPKFATYSVITVDDQIINGLLLTRDSECVQIKSADGQTHTIAVNQIEYQTQQRTSLMPDGLAAEMTAQELADLLAFLAEQR